MILDDLTILRKVFRIQKHVWVRFFKVGSAPFSDQVPVPSLYRFLSCFGIHFGSILCSLRYLRALIFLTLGGSNLRWFLDPLLSCFGWPKRSPKDARRVSPWRPRPGSPFGLHFSSILRYLWDLRAPIFLILLISLDSFLRCFGFRPNKLRQRK